MQDDGISLGTAIVKFYLDAKAAKLIEMNGAGFQGQWLDIKLNGTRLVATTAQEPTEKPPDYLSRFVGNLSRSIDKESLRAAFEECGEILQVQFATDRETQEFKGYDHIKFTETKVTNTSMNLAYTDICRQQIRVN